MAAIHRYATSLTWEGSTAAGYEGYERTHAISAAPATEVLALSSDPAFRGDGDRLNPEQLLVAAASSCQLLSFLAVAARARLDVVSYVDPATAEMPEDDPPMRIVRIDLHPTIVLADTGAARPGGERLHHLVEVAHKGCFIANSLRTEVAVHPSFEWRDAPGSLPRSG